MATITRELVPRVIVPNANTPFHNTRYARIAFGRRVCKQSSSYDDEEDQKKLDAKLRNSREKKYFDDLKALKKKQKASLSTKSEKDRMNEQKAIAATKARKKAKAATNKKKSSIHQGTKTVVQRDAEEKSHYTSSMKDMNRRGSAGIRQLADTDTDTGDSSPILSDSEKDILWREEQDEKVLNSDRW